MGVSFVHPRTLTYLWRMRILRGLLVLAGVLYR